MQLKRCEFCKHYDLGKCKKRAPITSPYDVNHMPIFPNMSFSDHCDDWDLTKDLYKANMYFEELNNEKENK